MMDLGNILIYQTEKGDTKIDVFFQNSNILQVQTEGERQIKRKKKHYKFIMILAIGYRVRSNVGMRFRNWASAILKDYFRKTSEGHMPMHNMRFMMGTEKV